ncbi:polymerase, partial [Ectothiorhodospira haloalkaliphila]
MRDLLLFAIMVGLVPVIFWRPWIGILAWFWVGLMVPHGLAWTFMRDFPIAAVMGGATLAALALSKDRRPMPFTREMVMMFVFVAFTAMTSYFAVNPSGAWDQWTNVAKILLITFITPVLIYSERRIVLLLLVITCSLGFYGLKGGIFTLTTGGSYMVLGPPGFLSGNTYIGLAMIMILPLILATARMFQRKWINWEAYGLPMVQRFSIPIGWGFYGVFWLTAIAILATYSRGALLGLVAVAPLLFLHMRYKTVMVSIAVLLVVVVGVTVPDRLMERWQTIETYEEDRSSMMRIQAWGVNWNMAMERPLTGMGFRSGRMGYDWWVSYANFEGPWTHVLSPHSMYFQLLGQHGFVGLGVYALLIGFTLLTLNRIRREARRRTGQIWLSEYAWAIMVGFWGLLVAGAFLDVAYFNLIFAFIALAIIMRRELEEAPSPD